MQPRDRSRAASAAQIGRIANDIKPDLLAESPKASDGAPIVGPDAVVESGNARTIALRRAYASGKAEGYRNYLRQNAARFGLDPKDVDAAREPVLVRERTQDVDRAEFARRANESSVAAMSPVEQARSDAARLEDLTGLDTNDDGTINPFRSAEFVRSFLKSVSPGERAAMVQADGRLSQAGMQRIRNAIFAKAYDDPDLVAMLSESTDSNVRNILAGMLRAAPEVAKLRDLVDAGARRDTGVAKDIALAVREFSQLRSEGKSVEQRLAQGEMFGEAGLDPRTRQLLEQLDEDSRSPKRVAESIIRDVEAAHAQGDPRQEGLRYALAKQVEDPRQGRLALDAPDLKAALDQANTWRDAMTAAVPHLPEHMRPLADLLQRAPATRDLTFQHEAPERVTSERDGQGMPVAAYYDTDAHGVWMRNDLADRDPRSAATTVLHEGTHAATTNAYATDHEFKTKIDKMFMQAKVLAGRQSHYGLTDPYEFMAEAMSNGRFQHYLAGIKTAGGTIWTRFAGAVKAAFQKIAKSVGIDVTKPNLLGDAIDAILGKATDTNNTGPPIARILQARAAMTRGIEAAPRANERLASPNRDDRELRERGRAPASRMDAERAFADGDRVFVAHDLDEKPREVYGVSELQGYTPDQMLVLPKARARLPSINREDEKNLPELAKKDPLYRRILSMPMIANARVAAQGLIRNFQHIVSPMTASSESKYKAMAKDYADAKRLAAYQYGRWFDILNRNFSSEQLKRMWEAGDEENDMRREQRQNGTPMDPSKGLASLPKTQRDVMDFMSAHGTALLAEAKKLGMYEGEGVDYWVPRTAARIGADGTFEPLLPGSDGTGGSPSTKSKNLISRNYDTTGEAEAALQAKEGTGAKFIRDIRTMPLAMRRLEEAVAGRHLVDNVLEASQDVALDPREFVSAPDHPAFKVYRADPDDPTAPWKIQTMMIPKEAEGPLKAVLSQPSGAVYKGLLGLKNWAVGNIMFSPFIHLGVELGRALPVMRGKMLTVGFWKDGAAMMRNDALMREAIQAGYVKIGRQNLQEDLGAMEREPELTPGRGLTAQALGLAARPFGAAARQAVMKGVDNVGDFVHGTLLWDRVAQLQAGIYLTSRKQFMAKGLDSRVAAITAAHIANRYAGALPQESISNIGRKIANLAMFSRSFTLGNLGVMKDTINGLPQDVRAQILRDGGQGQLDLATSLAKRKARAGFVADIAFMYAMNAVAQAGIGALAKHSQDDDWKTDLMGKLADLPHHLAAAAPDAANDLIHSFSTGMKRAGQDPVGAVLHPFDTAFSMTPNYRNEPGKENRVLWGHEADGTAIYMRLPTGKVGEEFTGWLTHAFVRGNDDAPSMLESKESTLVRGAQMAVSGKNGYTPIYKPNDQPATKLGKWALELMKEQVPADTIAAAYRELRGKGQPMDPEKIWGPLTGLTFSKGYPGGEEAGEDASVGREHQADVSAARKDVINAIREGDDAQAKKLMDEAHFTGEDRRSAYKAATIQGPHTSARARKLFQQTATPEEKARQETRLSSSP